MATMSVSVPENLKEKMLEMDEINWSAIARRAFEEKVEEIEFLKKIANKSKLTEKDVKELSDKINKGVASKFRGA